MLVGITTKTRILLYNCMKILFSIEIISNCVPKTHISIRYLHFYILFGTHFAMSFFVSHILFNFFCSKCCTIKIKSCIFATFLVNKRIKFSQYYLSASLYVVFTLTLTLFAKLVISISAMPDAVFTHSHFFTHSHTLALSQISH